MIIVDTGVLYALADRRDAHHAACVRWLVGVREPLIVPQPIISEAGYLIGDHLSAEAEAVFLESIGPGLPFTLEALVDSDLPRIAALVRQYGDFPLGTADAVVIAVAERLGTHQVATVDWRHFSAVRPRHVPAFTLLPERL